ncbi:MAG: hypothetical protein IPK83_16085 [Planctomycetes bacterium]|nr:hypothetical protein [Planctomycetota bacterium]
MAASSIPMESAVEAALFGWAYNRGAMHAAMQNVQIKQDIPLNLMVACLNQNPAKPPPVSVPN